MLMRTKTAKRKLLQRLEGALLVAGVLSQTQLVLGQAIIDNGSFVQMGINAAGHLNVPGGTPSMPSDSTTNVGLRYIPTNGESTAPGCLCEGWGVANADPGTGTFAGYANIASDGGVVGLVIQPGTGVTQTTGQIKPESVGSAFKSIVTAGNGRLRVTHIYHPSASPHLYQVDVTFENIGATSIGDLRYRRVMDWDIAPFTFHEWVEIHVGTATRLVRATSDGFLSANPLNPAGPNVGVPPTTLVPGSADYFSGPTDQGSSFDFTFGSLAAGESIRFTIYYGAAGNRTDALIAVATVRAQMYSLAIPSTSIAAAAGPATGGPHVFIFAFGRVGGTSVPSPRPTGLTATPGDQKVLLKWSDRNPDIRVAWDVYFREVFPNSSEWQLISGDPIIPNSPTSFTKSYLVNRNPADTSQYLLRNDVVYQFRVEAILGSSRSEFSEIVEAKPSNQAEVRPTVPVVLVHGFAPNGTFGYWNDALVPHFTDTLKWQFGGELLVKDSSPILFPEVDFITHVPNPAGDFFIVNFRDGQMHNGLDTWALELRKALAKINDLRAANGLLKTKFVLVAHSMGGIASRYYIQNNDFQIQKDVLSLITYGTPHQGSKKADFLLAREYLCKPFIPSLCADIDEVNLGLQQLNPNFGFIETLNSKEFPQDVAFTSLVGDSFCIPLHPLRGGDGVFNSDNQNMVNLPNPPSSHRFLKTQFCHMEEPSDVVSITTAVGHFPTIPLYHGVDELIFNVASPVDIVVTDPLGRSIGKTFNSIPVSVYEEVEDASGNLHDVVTIPLAVIGQYRVEVIPDPGALPTDTYGLKVTLNGVETALAQNQQVQNIPSQGYTVTVVPPNQIPVANAGTNRTVRLGSLVTLNGGGSSDPDNGPGPLTFSWTKVSGPAVTLSGATTATPTFTPTVAGTYTFRLVVNDGQDSSAPASVTITVPILGDIDLDGDVDNNDLSRITSVLNTKVNGPNDLRDLNGDGRIDALDSRILVTRCTRPRCATQ